MMFTMGGAAKDKQWNESWKHATFTLRLVFSKNFVGTYDFFGKKGIFHLFPSTAYAWKFDWIYFRIFKNFHSNHG